MPQAVGLAMSTTTMIIIITTMSLASAKTFHALRRGGSLWIENAGAADGPSRVKILGVVSADCH